MQWVEFSTASNMAEVSKLTESEHLLESFVVMELLKQRALLPSSPEVGHFRTSDGQGAGLIIESEDGLVYGFEIKRATRLQRKDFAGLRFLATSLGDRFAGGAVFYSGKQALKTSVDKIYSVPTSSLWAC